MKAVQLTQPGKITIVEIEKPALEKNQVMVKMGAVALNRRDQWIREGKYPNIQINTTLGSDGCGEVVALGSEVSQMWLGKIVMINPNVNWGENEKVQSSDYSVLGMPFDGTFSEFMAVDVDHIIEKPSFLTVEQAAALPLGGLTAYRAIMNHGQLNDNSSVLISGFGGGVAQFAFQFAIAMKARVYVTSGSREKIDRAIEMGANDGFNYKEEDWHKEALKKSGGFDIVIDSAGGNAINSFIKIMKPAGRIVFYGATNGLPDKIDLYRMFWNQITLQGSTMGNDTEFGEMVEFVDKYKITPLIDSVRSFNDILSAFDQMKAGERIGKLVIRLA